VKALAGQLHNVFTQVDVHRAADHAIDLGLLRPLSHSQAEELFAIIQQGGKAIRCI
jgi:hypothetical protein